jgi:L,D-transpeptidase ErfK/SrfK
MPKINSFVIYHLACTGQHFKWLLFSWAGFAKISLLLIGFLPLFWPHFACARKAVANIYVTPDKGYPSDMFTRTVIGTGIRHIVQKSETLLDIAKQYDLGFNEMADLYPDLNPWVPPQGTQLIIPTRWVLPESRKSGIILNLAELRLYYYLAGNLVKTFPVGIGDEGMTTPLGSFKITEKRVRPTWYIPPSLQAKYGAKSMPPGPNNPLGNYWMRLGNSPYGIHGTSNPWSVGRLATHGCIRLYDEDIEFLFEKVPTGTAVHIIYEPVKLGVLQGKIYVEVHPDIYKRIPNLHTHAYQRLIARKMVEKVDLVKFNAALHRKDGMPEEIGKVAQKNQASSETLDLSRQP